MKLTHPDSDQILDVADEHVDRYASQGWQPVDEDKAPEKAPPATTEKPAAGTSEEK